MSGHTPSRGRYIEGCRCSECRACNTAYANAARAKAYERTREALAALQALTDGELSEELAARGVPAAAIARYLAKRKS